MSLKSYFEPAQRKGLIGASEFIREAVLICLVSTLGVTAALGQMNYTVPQGMTTANLAPGSPTGSYGLSGFESINPFSGKLNFSLPLMRIGGRGSAGYPMNLNIQRNWSIQHTVDDPNLYIPHSETYFITHIYTPTDMPEGFLTADMNPGFMKATRTGTNFDMRVCGSNSVPCYDETLTRLFFAHPDGTQIEFRDILYGGKAIRHTNGVEEVSRGTHWVSVDGSNATFISNAAITDYRPRGTTAGHFYPSGTLYLSNGTKYTIAEGVVTLITDINGNKVTPGVNSTPGVDSLSREVTITSATGTGTESRVKTLAYKGTNAAPRTVKVHYSYLESCLSTGYSLTNYGGLFPISGHSGGVLDVTYNTEVVSSVELPDGREYEFRYNNYGELTEIILPTGGKIEYIWQASPGVYGQPEDPQTSPPSGGPSPDESANLRVYRRVEKRRVYEGGVLQSETVYGAPEYVYPGSTVTVQNYANLSGTLTLINKSKHYYNGSPYPDAYASLRPTQDPHYLDGRETKKEIYDANNTLLRKTETTYEAGTPLSAWTAGNINARVSQVTETLSDANLVSQKTFTYDSFNNVTDTYEYDYGSGSAGSLLRRSHTDYVTDTNYTAYTGSHLKSLPSQTWVSSDAAGNSKKSWTVYEYDNYTTDSNHAGLEPRSSVVGFDSTNYGTSFTRRGNVTGVTSYADAAAQTGAVTAYSQYDILGNVVMTIDANGNASTIGYDDNFGTADGNATTNSVPSQLNGNSTFAFATSVTNPYPFNWTAYTQYDYFTGQPVNTQDINGVISKTIYNDALDRPTQGVMAVGTSLESQTTIAYDDANRKITQTSDLGTLNDNSLKTVSFFDGLGRTTETRNYETSTVYRAVQTQYDALGRAYKVSNPFRAGDTLLWTQTYFDALGRVTKVKTPDNAEMLTSYSGNTVTVTDQAGKLRRSITNSIGQLTRIDEPNSSNQLGTISSPNQATYYTYNTNGQMIRVEQGSQNRYFMYDSLGRTLRISQPEQEVNTALNTSGNPDNNSWTGGFTYDNNGNVLTTTDAKGTTITSTYDALNRPLTRTYSDGTPTVTNYYDGAGLPSVPDYSKGKLTRVSSSVSDSRYTGFDILGRVTETKQITDSNTYTSSYQYNLAGALTEETLPSGRVVKNSFSSNGDLSLVETKSSGGSFSNRASDFTYTPDDKIKQLKLGNGLWETAQFNSRLQVTEFALGTTQGGNNVWKANYDYGELQTNGTVDATKNAGNIAKQTITFSGLANPFVQGYKYDPLDRITEAKETVNGTQTWVQSWSYDRYGNRSAFSQDLFGQTTVSNPTINTATNRFNSGQGFTFDKNGNVTLDHNGYQFTYNGDNKQTQVVLSLEKGGLTTMGQYYYDGEGKRVKKTTYTGDNVIFVYTAGKLVEERNASTNAVQTSYIYAGSQLLSTETASATNYTVTDNLGSPRVIVNGSGTVGSRRDFMPFGEELYVDGTYRKTSDGYGTSGSDAVRQRFTGYQRDTETGLDFAEARMYQNQHARFTAIDPLLASGKSADPQTFNRYVYTMNRPLILVDASGMQAGKPSSWVNTPMFVDPTGKIFSTTQDKGYIPFKGSDYATAGGKNFQVTGNGYGEIAIPPPSDADRAAMQSAAETLAWARSIINAGNQIISYTIDPLQDVWPAEHREAAMHAVGPAAFTMAPFVIEGRVASAVSAETSAAQRILNTVSGQLAAEPALAQTVLSPAQYASGQTSASVARMQFGNAIENLFWKEVNRVGGLGLQRLGGAGRADGIANGQLFDITTTNPVTIQRHVARPYGSDLQFLLYERPPSFTTFPKP